MPLLLRENARERRRLTELACARRIGTDPLCDALDWQLEDALPLRGPPGVYPAIAALAVEAPASSLDQIFIQSLCDYAVIHEALDLSDAMGAGSLPREQSIEVNSFR